MKQIIKNYTFSTSGKTITLTDFSTIRLDRLLLVVDVTTNKVLYNYADSSVTAATVATNVVTLAALQGGEANGDSLIIFYDQVTADPNATVYDGGQRTMAASRPVVLASDQSSIPVTATLAAETTKVIGVVRNSDGAGNLLTSNSTTTAAKFGLDSNILSILGTAPTTAGKLDVKGADGDLFVRQSTATNLNAQVVGALASDTVNGGNPLKMGAVFNNSLPTFTDTHVADLQMTNHGALFVTIKDGFNSITGATSGSDGASNSITGLWSYDRPHTFNGTTWDRQTGNQDNISLFASAAHTTTQTGGDQTNFNARGVIVTLDMTIVGTGSVTLEIDMKDPVSGKYIPMLTGAAVTSNVTNIYTVYPGASATANVSANAPLPRTWRVKVTANNANSATYSVGASLTL